MTAGSGIFGSSHPIKPHLLVGGGGLSGEIADVRKDLATNFRGMAAIGVEEWINLVGTGAPGAAVLLAATATVASVVTVLPAGLLAAGLAQLAAHARQLTFTTAGTTASDAPANVVINGIDQNGVAETETLIISQTAATVTSAKYYSAITSIVYPAADGTGATVSIGIAAATVKPAFAPTVAPLTVAGSALIQGALNSSPRVLIFTTAGTTASDAPANVVITGHDANGNVQSETLNLAQTATTATSAKYYKSIDSLAFAAADGAGSTIAITFGTSIGLSRKAIARSGATPSIIKELMDGSAPTAGALIAAGTAIPNGAYTPNTLGNDVHDYSVMYEFDATVP
jgi:hypothetical protein